MKAATIRFIIWDVGTVNVSHPRVCVCLTNYTCVCASTGSITMYVWQASFRRGGGVEWDSGCGCVFRGQAARHTCMLVVLSFAVLDVRPPSFSFSLIRTSNFSAVDSSNECGGGGDGGLLGLFRAALGEVLHQDPAKRDRRLSMPHSNSKSSQLPFVPVDLALRPVLGSRGLD